MVDVLVIQNSKIEGLCALENLLVSDGFKIKTIYAKKEKIPNEDFQLLVILGGNQSANDKLSYLSLEEELIRKSVSKERPVLGICLGSQLIAKTFGSKVTTGKLQEIGFYQDISINSKSKLFSGIENPMTVFHWHGDTFTLPTSSLRMASSKNYENQAFQYKSAVGLQFHLEIDEKSVKLWLEKSKEKISKIPYINHEKILGDISEKIPKVQNNLNIFYKNFKSQFNL